MIDNDVRDAYSVWISDRGEGTLTRFVDAFAAGATWQKERDSVQPLMVNGADDMEDIRNALAQVAESMTFMLRQQQDLAAMGLRGTDRGVAILKHLQEIGDNVRGVSGAIGDKFGVLLDAIKQLSEPTEEDALASLDAFVNDERENADKTSAVSIEDVDDATLRDLATTEQIEPSMYWREVDRRQKDRLNKMAEVHIGMDLAKPGSDVTGYQIIVKNPATFRDVCAALETVCEISRAAGVVLDFTVKAQA